MKEITTAFSHAFRGVFTFIKTERNASVHLVLSLVTIGLGMLLGVSKNDWLWLAAAICAVLVTEMLNSAIEKVCNRITRSNDKEIKQIKDIAAGAVLLTAIFALVIGGAIFLPYIFT